MDNTKHNKYKDIKLPSFKDIEIAKGGQLTEEAIQELWDKCIPAPSSMTMSVGMLRMLVKLALRNGECTEFYAKAADQLRDYSDNTLVTINESGIYPEV